MRYRILLHPPATPPAAACADPRAALAAYLDQLARHGILLDVAWAPLPHGGDALAELLVASRSQAEAEEWARRLPTTAGPLAGHRVHVVAVAA